MDLFGFAAVFGFIALIFVNGAVASAKNLSVGLVVVGSVFLTPVVMWMYVLAMPVMPPREDDVTTLARGTRVPKGATFPARPDGL